MFEREQAEQIEQAEQEEAAFGLSRPDVQGEGALDANTEVTSCLLTSLTTLATFTALIASLPTLGPFTAHKGVVR